MDGHESLDENPVVIVGVGKLNLYPRTSRLVASLMLLQRAICPGGFATPLRYGIFSRTEGRVMERCHLPDSMPKDLENRRDQRKIAMAIDHEATSFKRM